MKELDKTPVSDLGLSRWANFWLRFDGVYTIADLIAMTPAGLRHGTLGIGKKTYDEIIVKLTQRGLTLYRGPVCVC